MNCISTDSPALYSKEINCLTTLLFIEDKISRLPALGVEVFSIT